MNQYYNGAIETWINMTEYWIKQIELGKNIKEGNRK